MTRNGLPAAVLVSSEGPWFRARVWIDTEYPAEGPDTVRHVQEARADAGVIRVEAHPKRRVRQASPSDGQSKDDVPSPVILSHGVAVCSMGFTSEALAVSRRVRAQPCAYCESDRTYAYKASPDHWFCKNCDGYSERENDNTHWGEQHVLGHGGGQWRIWPQKVVHPDGKTVMTVDRSVVIAKFPVGADGWRDAWQKFISLEPRYPAKRRWSRWKPVVGATIFWMVALGLALAAIAANGLIAIALTTVLALYLMFFLVAALSESLPWNE